MDTINYDYINYNKTIKYLLFVLFSFIIIYNTINDDLTIVIFICAVLTIIYYILDSYFPCCYIYK
jgi:hypothetical protein